MTSSAGSRKDKTLCAVKYCRNLRAKGRTICHKCHKRQYRANNPKSAAYDTLKDHARERNLPFTLSRKEFSKLVEGTKVFKEDGSRDSDWHIDRIDPTKGYEASNLQVLHVHDNIVKGNQERWDSKYKRHLKYRKYDTTNTKIDEGDDIDQPF